MSKFCTLCGKPLPEDGVFCPNCGSRVDASVNTEPAEQPAAPQPEPIATQPLDAEPTCEAPEKPAKKVKWWVVAIPVVLVVALLAAILWQPLLLLISPKTAAALAMAKTASQLAKRYEDSPAAVLGQVSEFEDGVKISLAGEAEVEGERFSAEIDMLADKQKRFSAGAALRYNDTEYGAGVYMDADVLAASVSFFEEGQYYGITFDSFREDIKKSVLANYLTDEEIDQMADALEKISESYSKETDIEALLEPYQEIISDYIMDMKAEKGSAEIRVNGESKNCSTVSFIIEEDDLRELCDQIIDTLENDEDLKGLLLDEGMLSASYGDMGGYDIDEIWERDVVGALDDGIDEILDAIDFEAELIYYIYSGRVVNLRLDGEVEADGEIYGVRLDMNYGLNAATDDISCKLTIEYEGEELVIKLTSKITNEKDQFKETITYRVETPVGDVAEAELGSKWNKETGKLTLSLGYSDNYSSNELSVSCKLVELDDGFKITVDQDDVVALLEATGSVMPEGLEFEVSLSCTECGEVSRPNFVNLDQWDEKWLEDLQKAIKALIPEDDASAVY